VAMSARDWISAASSCPSSRIFSGRSSDILSDSQSSDRCRCPYPSVLDWIFGCLSGCTSGCGTGRISDSKSDCILSGTVLSKTGFSGRSESESLSGSGSPSISASGGYSGGRSVVPKVIGGPRFIGSCRRWSNSIPGSSRPL
jgi:hypothetical protein